MRRILVTAIALGLATPALACPPVADRSAELATLIDRAQEAPNEMAGREISNQMWEIWTTAPDEAAQELLRQGTSALRVADSLRAIAAFDALVDYCPDYAEGYNQRAFVYFLNGEFEKALVDLERTVAINAEHVGALSGLALTLTALGREDEAQDWLRAALALNPWIPERGLLKEPAGEEL
jgi:tetratricopeptide (TPR) repeat protein